MADEYEGPERRKFKAFPGWKIVLYGWMIGITIIVIWSLHDVRNLVNKNRNLTRENQNRIIDIQQSGEASCKSTYRTINRLLDISVAGRKLSPKRQEILDQMRAAINPTKCHKQVSTTKAKGGR